jgi:2-C-methyl-D-erythritol 4-phosphate cytidylyltransferase
MKTRSIIITAAGSGRRMGTDRPKQFLEVLGKPVLMHTLERLHRFDPDSQLVVTLPESSLGEWKTLCQAYGFQLPVEIVSGGKERYHSIQNALGHCTGDLIAVHDGVRPLVAAGTLERLFDAAEMHPAVIPVVEVKDSLRILDGNSSRAVARTNYRSVQTPQVFDAVVLRKAYELPFSEQITDDASLVEQSGAPIHLVEGNEENIKLTTPSDLVLAGILLRT